MSIIIELHTLFCDPLQENEPSLAKILELSVQCVYNCMSKCTKIDHNHILHYGVRDAFTNLLKAVLEWSGPEPSPTPAFISIFAKAKLPGLYWGAPLFSLALMYM